MTTQYKGKGWNKSHVHSWHTKGSKLSEGRAEGRFQVVDSRGTVLHTYVYEKKANEVCESHNKIISEFKEMGRDTDKDGIFPAIVKQLF